MGYFCHCCGAVTPDPAGRFCPHCGGRLPEAPGQDPPAAPVAGHFRGIPAPVFAACLFLVMVVAAILVQAIPLHLIPVFAAANTSASPPPVLIPGGTVPATRTISASAQGSPFPSLYKTSNTTSREAPVINATSLGMRIHERVNRMRQEHGLSALGTDPALASIARAHSADMASTGYFGHVNLNEMDPTSRGAAAGYTCHKAADPYYTYPVAENLYATYRYSSVLLVEGRETTFAWTTEESIAEETVDAWMNSPDHRDNILDTGMGREGIGVAFGQDDMIFITEDFC
jgi:uncharacterized protein YkwD